MFFVIDRSMRSIDELVLDKLKTKTFGGVPFPQLSRSSQKKRMKIELKKLLKHSKKSTTLTQGTDDIPATQGTDDIPATQGTDDIPATQGTDDIPATQGIQEEQKQQHTRSRDKLKMAIENGIKVAIDCSMLHLMSAKEICMLAKQIMITYSTNNKASKPFHLYLTSLKEGGVLHTECNRVAPQFSEWLLERKEAHYSEIFDHSSIVYLSPDAPDILEEIDKDHTYVLGGLVDEGLVTGYTYNAACKRDLHSARLPIDKYMTTSPQHCALTINQVLNIMADVYGGVTWPEALMNSVPQRKGYKLKPEYEL